MRKLFEDFIDDIESKDLEVQSEDLGDMRPEAYQYMFFMPVDYLDLCDLKPIDKTMQRYLYIVERVLDNNRSIIDYSVPVYVTRSVWLSDFDRLLHVKQKEEYPENDFRHHANDHNTTLAFYANCDFRTVESFEQFVESMEVIYPTKCRPQLYYMKTDDPEHELYYPRSIFYKKRKFKQQDINKTVYAAQVANEIGQVAPIVKKSFDYVHQQVYEIAGLNPGQIIINHAIKQTDIEQKQSLTIPKKLKEMLIGSTVNPDVLTPDKEKEHSMKWKTIWMDVKTPKFSSTNLNLLNEKNNDIVNYVRNMITEGRAVIHDVAIKCYNANLDWMMIYYLGPIYYQADESWYECVMLGECQVSEDEITLTFEKVFSDELMKDKKFAEMADDLMYALFDKANSY